MSLIPQNDIAREVLRHLPCSHPPQGGYFGGVTYCIGVAVSNMVDAFELGATIGAEVEFLGEIRCDRIGLQYYLVFRNAEVSQGVSDNG